MLEKMTSNFVLTALQRRKILIQIISSSVRSKLNYFSRAICNRLDISHFSCVHNEVSYSSSCVSNSFCCHANHKYVSQLSRVSHLF